jgi:hypothetical protein
MNNGNGTTTDQGKKKPASAGNAPDQISIPKIDIVHMDIPIEAMPGSTLIVHAWSHKALTQMRDKQTGKAVGKKAPKDPKAEFEASRYRDEKGHDVLKSVAFKSCIVDAASFVDNVTKVMLRGALFIPGEWVRIEYDEIVMREDPVNVGGFNKVADLRYRAEFKGWRATIPIEFNRQMITIEQIVNLINIGGFSIGVGEWRPQKDGQSGRFRVCESGAVETGRRKRN